MQLLRADTPSGEKAVIVLDHVTHLTATNIGTLVHLSSSKAVTVRVPMEELAQMLEAVSG